MTSIPNLHHVGKHAVHVLRKGRGAAVAGAVVLLVELVQHGAKVCRNC